MKIKTEIARELFEIEEVGKDFRGYEIVKTEEWTAEGKYQYHVLILEDISTKKLYSISESRSGSPFSDYYYNWEDEGEEVDAVEVVAVEKMTIVYEEVKQKGN